MDFVCYPLGQQALFINFNEAHFHTLYKMLVFVTEPKCVSRIIRYCLNEFLAPKGLNGFKCTHLMKM
jgi:hypothetical protein